MQAHPSSLPISHSFRRLCVRVLAASFAVGAAAVAWRLLHGMT